MTSRPLPAVPAALLALVLTLALTTSAAGVARADDPLPPGHFTGADGVVYPSAPTVVRGVDGHLFYGPDYDVACAYGSRFVVVMERLARFARIIRASGREVVWTMGLNKSTVLPELLDPATLPHGECDRVGFARQRKAVAAYADPGYLDLVAPLAASRRQVYFRTDAHWNTVGAAVYAKALATRLDPRLGRLQHYRYGTETRVGSLTELIGDGTAEVSPTASPATRVAVRTARGSEPWSGYPALTFDHSWTTRPAGRTYPGRTLLLGDSFMMFALENLRPLFRHGHWLWMFKTTPDDMIRAITRSDTVVMETYQDFALFTPLASRSFLSALRKALR